jgi:flagellar assembly protein FliH
MTRIIKAGDNHPDPDRLHAAQLNLADFAAEARSVVLDARKQAAQITAEARARAESIEREIREQAYAEGFARGQNDGYADGSERAIAETTQEYAERYQELLDLARKAVDGLDAARRTGLRRDAGEVLRMAVALAERIVGKVAGRDLAAAEANLAKALELAHLGGQVAVHASPRQVEALEAHLGEFVARLDTDADVRLVADPEVSPGGVMVVTPEGKIDATVETQLANVTRILLNRDPSVPSTPLAPSAPTGTYESDLPSGAYVPSEGRRTIRTHGNT